MGTRLAVPATFTDSPIRRGSIVPASSTGRTEEHITLGTALLSLYARKDDIRALVSFEIPAFLLLVMLIAGIILAVGGILGIVVPFGRIKDWIVEQWNKWFDSPRYRCRRAKASELETVRSLAKSFFGDEVSDLERMRNWQKKNGRLFWILFAERTRKGKKLNEQKLVGYFCVLPITKMAVAAVEREELFGENFLAEHIVKENGMPAALAP